MRWIAESIEELAGIAQKFCGLIDDNHRVFAFRAPMGSGKTTFIHAVLKELGVATNEGSPTYPIVLSYDTPLNGELFHIDAYRLKDDQEAFDIGLDEMLNDGAICLVEWPQNIEDLLPESTIWVDITTLANNHREITVNL